MISLLAIDDIEEGTSKGIEVKGAYLFAVKKDDQLVLYYNRCPHLGTPSSGRKTASWMPMAP
jgi:nitrite reductase/ring-hydroxylating ferredoxin subunit